MNALRAVSLLLATISMGLIAGAFALYAHAIMPGLAKTDDRTFVGSFQAIDRAIINPWFMIFGFGGALVFTLIAGLTQIGKKPFAWIAIAFVLYLIAFIMTIAINVPLNDALKAAGDPNTIDVASAREAFNEARWRTSNLIRVVLSTGAFGLLTWALVMHGRATT